MLGSPHAWRLALFCGASLALVCGALVFSGSGNELSQLPLQPRSSGVVATPVGGMSAGALRTQARRFLGAFLRYEVGELDQRVHRVLRRTATAGFAATLLREPPRPVGRALRSARLARLSLSALSVSPPRALVSGSALRGRSAEQFSFLFVLHDGVWLASGPGQ